MDNKVELLAPAGNWEAFLAAVENGADAVYLGGKLFNARQFAGNFDEDQLKKALDYAHVRGVKVYLAMNTLIADHELRQAVDFAESAYLSGIDGIIVQDTGFAGMLKELYPDLNLHASTQMTIYNLDGVKALEQLGFKRVVLARELSLGEIAYIAQNSPLEIEVFIHGALCVCYSGQCLMSSIIGGRSGNRGKCAQPCRLTYELIKESGDGLAEGGQISAGVFGKYLLSPKDMCSVGIIGDVINTGIKSLKIEGRMKTPEYVATVVRIYRKYVDEAMSGGAKQIDVDEGDLKDLAQIFNRGGFSKGYLIGKQGSSMMCYEKPKNWGIYLGKVISYDKYKRTVKLKLEDTLSIGDGVEVWNGEDEQPGNIITEIKVKGKNSNQAEKGSIAEVGSISGSIGKGNMVFKTSDKKLNTQARETFAEGRNLRRIGLEGEFILKREAPLSFSVSDGENNKVLVESEIFPEVAVNKPLTRERIAEQLGRTGGTPFVFEKIDVQLDPGLTAPVSEINRLRREALKLMEKARTSSYDRKLTEETVEKKKEILYFLGNGRNKIEYGQKGEQKLKISVYFYKWDEERASACRDLNADRLYLPFSALLNESARREVRTYRNEGMEVFAWIPSVTRGNYDSLIKSRLRAVVETGIDGLLVGNLGTLQCIYSASADIFKGDEGNRLKIAGDYALNVFNSLSLEELKGLGLSGITLSPEMTLAQIENLKRIPGLAKETVVYGRIPLMVSEYCPVGSIAGGFSEGSKCDEACRKGEYHLKDRKGMEFPLLCDRTDCRSALLNANVLFVPDSLNKIRASGVDMVRLYISDERPEEVREIVGMHRDIVENGADGISRHEKLINRIKARGFTKGHYFRGV